MKPASIHFVKGATRWSHLVSDGRPEIAFLGRSNVGKSSLINMLVGRKGLARISNTPGKTREFNFYLVDERFYLVDLPGYGYARVSKTDRERWLQLIARYLAEREPLRGVFHLIDGRHPPTSLDEELMEAMRGIGIPYLVILTKGDKISGNERVRNRQAVESALASHAIEAPIMLSSSAKKVGRDEIWDWIRRLVGGGG